MDAVVLAGGYATRLWPITKDRPKMFLPVGETTVVDRLLADLETDERIEDVYVSTNERFAEDFRKHIAHSPYEKPQLSVEETAEEDEKFGVVGALAQLIDRENVDDDLLVVAGDNLVSFDLSAFVDFYDRTETPALAAYDVGSRERATAYGLVELDGERVVDFQEKPDEPESTLVSIACYAFPADVLPQFEAYLAGDSNPDEPGWFLQWLQTRRAVHAFEFDEAWFDIGSPEGYLDAVAWALDGDSRIADEATVQNATLDCVHVMPGATIEDATVANAVVFPEATIRDATVRRSIVDEHATVAGVSIADSTVGAHSSIDAIEEAPP